MSGTSSLLWLHVPSCRAGGLGYSASVFILSLPVVLWAGFTPEQCRRMAEWLQPWFCAIPPPKLAFVACFWIWPCPRIKNKGNIISPWLWAGELFFQRSSWLHEVWHHLSILASSVTQLEVQHVVCLFGHLAVSCLRFFIKMIHLESNMCHPLGDFSRALHNDWQGYLIDKFNKISLISMTRFVWSQLWCLCVLFESQVAAWLKPVIT